MAKRERLTRSLSKDVFERRMSIGGGLFELFGRDSEQIPGEIVLIKEKRLTNTHQAYLKRKRLTSDSRASLKDVPT